MASRWPMTRLPRRSSILTSFSRSPSCIRATGMRVQLLTTSAMSFGVTSSWSIREPSPCTSASLALWASNWRWSSGRRPYWSSLALLNSPRRWACSSSVRAASIWRWMVPGFVDLGFLRLELRGQPRALFAQVGEFLFQPGEPVAAGGVLFLRQRLTLHLALHDLAVQLVDFRRLGIEFDLQARGRLVHEIDGLVRQETLGQVAMRKLRRRDQGRVEDAHAVMDLVTLLQPAQDGDGVLDARLIDDDRLETAFQRGVLFDVLAVFVERGRADGAQFAARELGLEQVGRVHRTLRRARADDGVQFVDEQDDLPLAGRDFLEERLEPVLEFAAELRARDHGPRGPWR